MFLRPLLSFWRLLETNWDVDEDEDEFRLKAGVTARELGA